MQYSKYQINVFDFVENGNGNAVIAAVAGSGKTTTIVEAASRIPLRKSALFLSFNKLIAEELSKRVPSHVKVKTFHGLGNGYIKSTFPSMNYDSYKFYKYSDKLLDPYIKNNFSKKYHYAAVSEFREFINILRNNAVVIPEILTNKKISDIIDNIYNIQSNNFNFELIGAEDEYVLAIKTLHAMNADRSIFDFNDMIYLPVINQQIKNNIFTYDYVFVDECQDLNITQQTLLDVIVKPEKGRFIAVGDEHQAIYGFAGADVHSYKKLTKKENTITLPLSFCYRCGTNIIKYARGFVKQIEAVEGKHEGILRDGDAHEAVSGDLILSRVNKNLISLFFSLLKDKKKSYIKGKDIGENLTKMITKSDAKDLVKFSKYTNEELKKIKLKLETKIGRLIDQETFEASSEYQHFMEKIDCINTLYDHYKKELKSFQELKDKISLIFKDEGDGIVLSTVHKAKGLENDKVFLLDAYMFPAFFAKEEWEKIQEQNLYYVAITRAKNELVFINENFDRRVYRYLILNQYDSLRDLMKKKKINENEIYFLEDLSSYEFNFSSDKNDRIYSYYKNKGFLSLKELEEKHKKILNGTVNTKI